MTNLIARAAAIVAEVVEEHQPGPDGFEDVCWCEHDETTHCYGDHVAAAVMAALVEQLGLREDDLVTADFFGRGSPPTDNGRLITDWTPRDTTTEGAPA